jgi:hypothetical protein
MQNDVWAAVSAACCTGCLSCPGGGAVERNRLLNYKVLRSPPTNPGWGGGKLPPPSPPVAGAWSLLMIPRIISNQRNFPHFFVWNPRGGGGVKRRRLNTRVDCVHTHTHTGSQRRKKKWHNVVFTECYHLCRINSLISTKETNPSNSVLPRKEIGDGPRTVKTTFYLSF